MSRVNNRVQIFFSTHLNFKKMKKRVLLPLLVAALWATPAVASPYVSVSAGIGTPANSDMTFSGITYGGAVQYKSGGVYGAAVGVKSGDYRAEGAIGYQTSGIDKAISLPLTGGEVSVVSYMANGYRDFAQKNSAFTPYLTVGVGIADVQAAESGVTFIDQRAFAWQAGFGVGIKASDNVVVDLGYRYFNTANVTSHSLAPIPVDFSVSSSNFLFGVRCGI